MKTVKHISIVDDSKLFTKENKAKTVILGDRSESYTHGEDICNVSFGDRIKSETKGNKAYSAALGWSSQSYTQGDSARNVTLGDFSKSETKGNKAYSAALGWYSHSYTQGDGARSVTFGWHSPSETIGRDTIACALGYGARVKAHDGLVIIAQYDKNKNPLKTYSAKVGETILGVTIEPNKWYGFDEDGVFKIFTEEEAYSKYKVACPWFI